jgi:Ser/Thr protein kinase RdoA (MazF antagonist)
LNRGKEGLILPAEVDTSSTRRISLPREALPLSLAVIRDKFAVPATAVETLGTGLINQTFLVSGERGEKYVLQRLHSIFPPEVNLDMEVVTVRLQDRGLVTPRLIRTVSGHLWLEMADGIWRLMTYIPGISVDRVDSAERAYEAGRLLGRFHMALSDLDYRFLGARGGIHETPRHLRNLELALDRHRDHAAYHRIRPVAEEILSAASKLTPLPALAERVVHGDPKISNFIFDAASGEGLCLVDLDTLNRMALPLELGDALRSWCNPAGEDSDTTDFSLGFFRAALTGYASEAGRWISPAEAASLVDATMTIMIELAARFCADALNESYFAWDPVRFPSRSEHNRVRAEGQLRAWEACRKMETQLSEVSREVFGLTPR